MIALDTYETYDGFTEREKIAVTLGKELTANPQHKTISDEPLAVSQETQKRLKEHFTDAEITELVSGITMFNLLNRFNRFLDPELDVEPPPPELVALLDK